MKRPMPRLGGLLLFLSAAPAVSACPECRAQVNSGVYSRGFATTLLVVLLPLVVLALVGVGVYYAKEIKAKFKGRAGEWQATQTARR